MAKGNTLSKVASWAFLAGVVLAVILGAMGAASGTWILVLVLIGLIVGLLNVTGKEVTPFLLSGAVLIIASALGGSVFTGVMYVEDILAALLAIFTPATVIVAIKNVFSLARN
ncbi:hypothetical protein HYW74_01290 [Candidatus Pacearchaeota archaeon]|nr:hypothetical protein [Candidatus Pacearchaeota archaeon]